MGKGILSNIQKDFKIEFRNRYALNISFSFAIITTLAISLAAGGVPLSPLMRSVIFWLIIFFSAMNGLSHIFIREEDQQTSLFLRLHSSPDAVFISKCLFNIIMFFLLLCVITPVYIFFLQVEIRSILYFIGTVIVGGFAIAASVTILAAMVAKAGGKGSLFTVISFPIVLPILWVAMKATTLACEKQDVTAYNYLVFLLAFSGAMVAVSFIIFEYIWVDE